MHEGKVRTRNYNRPAEAAASSKPLKPSMSFQMHALDEIVYMELHSGEGDSVAAGEPCGEIESTRSVSAIYATVTGEITAINPAVVDQPKVINDDP